MLDSRNSNQRYAHEHPPNGKCHLNNPLGFSARWTIEAKPGASKSPACRLRIGRGGHRGNPGIALVHGSNAHLEWWRFVAPFLADQFRVVALDLSGNGDSGWRERYTGRAFADEVWAVCEAAELGPRPFVVGHSFGGFVVLETGHLYGSRLGGIILADFTVNPPEDYTEWGRRAEREGKTPRATRVYPDIDAALGRFR